MGLFSRWRRRSTETVTALLGGEPPVLVDDAANSFGVESKGKAQVRGNGCLMATEHQLGFRMWVGRKQLVIDRSAITAVDTTRSHLGKTVGRKLLRVAWDGPHGPDRVAWFVRDLPAWLAELGGTDG